MALKPFSVLAEVDIYAGGEFTYVEVSGVIRYVKMKARTLMIGAVEVPPNSGRV
jgi:hypothetical protein